MDTQSRQMFPTTPKTEMRPFTGSEHSDAEDDDDYTMDDSGQRKSTMEQAALLHKDTHHEGLLLTKLNTLRKEGSLCDTVLAVGNQTVRGHRAVLACSSPRLMELFKDEPGNHPTTPLEEHYELPNHMDFDSLCLLIDYAYTSKLEVAGNMVSAVYQTAHKLKMDRAAEICSNYLADHLSLRNCLDVRAFANSNCDENLTSRTDAFIQEKFEELLEGEWLINLPKFSLSILGVSKKDLAENTEHLVSDLVLEWLQSALHDNNFDALIQEPHFLYLTPDNTLRDVTDEALDQSSDELKESPYVQDYKKYCKSKKISVTKGVSSNRRGNSTESSPNSTVTNGNRKSSSEKWLEKEWKIIATHPVKERALLAIAMVADRLCLLSLHTPPAAQQQPQVEVDAPLPSVTPSPPWSNGDKFEQEFGKAHVGNGSQPSPPLGSPKTRSESFEKQLSLVPLAKMSSGRCGLGTVVFDGKLYAIGGYERGECLATCESFDLGSNTWSPLPSLPSARGRFDVTRCGQRLFCCGGSDGAKELSSVHYYEVQARQWKKSTDMQAERSSAGVISIKNKVYVIGGWSGCNSVSTCEVLDVDTGEWSYRSDMNERRSQLAVCRYKDKIIAVGGATAWECLSSAEIYDPETDEWTVLPPMVVHRRGASCAIFNGKMYVVGGSDGQYSLKSTEVLDLDTFTWSPGPPLNAPRANLCVSVCQGRLFAVGGFSGKKFLDTVEFLEPGSEEWSRFVPAAIADSPQVIGETESQQKDIPADEVISRRGTGDATAIIDKENNIAKFIKNCLESKTAEDSLFRDKTHNVVNGCSQNGTSEGYLS